MSVTLPLMKSERLSFGTLSPRQVWRLALPRSRSTRVTDLPIRLKHIAMLLEMKLLPMPPLPPPTAQIVLGICGAKRKTLCVGGLLKSDIYLATFSEFLFGSRGPDIKGLHRVPD